MIKKNIIQKLSILHLPTKIILSLFFLLYVLFSYANQDSLRINELEKRLSIIEGLKENQERGLELKFEELKSASKNNWILLIIIGSFSLISIISTFYKVNKNVTEKLNAKFDNIIKQNETSIIKIIKQYDKEACLKGSKKILVISPLEGNTDFIRKFFKMEFCIDNVRFRENDKYVKETNFKPDLIFFNNEFGLINKDLILEYISKSSNKIVFFYFGAQRLDTDLGDRLNFANSKSQIYGNLINILRIQELL